MTGWATTNAESDDSSVEGIDRTEELQVEEAREHYQTALSLHAKGPAAFSAAADAYAALFELDAFQVNDEDGDDDDDSEIDEEAEEEDEEGEYDETDGSVDDDTEMIEKLKIGQTGGEPVEGLPYIRHVSYKNYGQFLLDRLQYRLRSDVSNGEITSNDFKELGDEIVNILTNFLAALSYDSSESLLWRKTARLAEYLGNFRMARYCLESAVRVATDQSCEGLQLTVEVRLARGQLHHLLRNIDDSMPSRSTDPSTMGAALRGKIDPFSWLTGALQSAGGFKVVQPVGTDEVPPTILELEAANWTSLFVTASDALKDWNGGLITGLNVRFVLPENERDVIGLATASTFSPTAMDSNVGQPISGETPLEAQPAEGVVQDTELVSPTRSEPEADPMIVTSDCIASKRKSITDDADEGEGIRARSKRIKVRESLQQQGFTKLGVKSAELQVDPSHRLQGLKRSDDEFIRSSQMLLKETETFKEGAYDEARNTMQGRFQASRKSMDAQIRPYSLLHDLYRSWNDDKGRSLLADHMSRRSSTAEATTVSTDELLRALLETMKPPTASAVVIEENRESDERKQVQDYVDRLNRQRMHLSDAALIMLTDCLTASDASKPTNYMAAAWGPEFRAAVQTIISALNADAYETISSGIDSEPERREHFSVLAECILELKAEALMNSNVRPDHADERLEILVEDLDRWEMLARRALVTSMNGQHPSQNLVALQLRHTWMTVLLMERTGQSTGKLDLVYLQDAREMFLQQEKTQGSSILPLRLPNCLFAPELSSGVADSAMRRILLTGALQDMLESDEEDPLKIIESSEALLEHASITWKSMAQDADDPILDPGGRENGLLSVGDELLKALLRAPATVRIHLWRRLQKAYTAIGYREKALACSLSILQVIVEDLTGTPRSRMLSQSEVISDLRELMNISQEILESLNNLSEPFSAMDASALDDAIQVTWQVLCLLLGDLWYRDAVAAGSMTRFEDDSRVYRTFDKVGDHMANTRTKLAVIMYHLMREYAKEVDADIDELVYLEYLRAFHSTLSERAACATANMSFLKLAKSEVLRWHSEGLGVSPDLAQLMWEMHGLRIAGEVYILEDHECSETRLDAATAMQLVDFVLDHMKRIPEKDLAKADCQNVIDKIDKQLPNWTANGVVKNNKQIITSYLEGVIRPKELIGANHGRLAIPAVENMRIEPGYGQIAAKGWLFAKGNLLLRKWKASTTKQIHPDSTDLSLASVMLQRDLYQNPSNWESWFRLGQVCHEQLDVKARTPTEPVWLRFDNQEGILLEKQAIHAFAMAMSLYKQSPEPSIESARKFGEMCLDYGYRIYGSARPPFSARAFAAPEADSFVNDIHNGVLRTPRYPPFSQIQAMTLAAELFEVRSGWEQLYMISKCRWKLSAEHLTAALARYEMVTDAFERARRCTNQEKTQENLDEALKHKNAVIELCKKSDASLLSALAYMQDAIRAIPETDKRHKAETVLEPHYKLISMVNKLVRPTRLPPKDLESHSDRFKWRDNWRQGHELACVSHYAKNVFQESHPQNREEWDSWILAALKVLRHADKDHWHHRMSYRAAMIWYRKGLATSDLEVPVREFEQSEHMMHAKAQLVGPDRKYMFKPSGDWQIWRPPHERAGRHFAYTAMYIELYTRILEHLRDLHPYELLLRKLQKKANDVHEHKVVWRRVVIRYLDTIRRVANIDGNAAPDEWSAVSRAIFETVTPDTFETVAKLLEEEVAGLPSAQRLVEIVEVKKLNEKMGAVAEIEKLLADVYANIFADRLPAYHRAEEARREAARKAKAEREAQASSAAFIPSSPRRPVSNPMDLSSMLSDTSVHSPSPSPNRPLQILAPKPGPPGGDSIPRSVPGGRNGDGETQPKRAAKAGISQREIVKRAELLAIVAKRVFGVLKEGTAKKRSEVVDLISPALPPEGSGVERDGVSPLDGGLEPESQMEDSALMLNAEVPVESSADESEDEMVRRQLGEERRVVEISDEEGLGVEGDGEEEESVKSHESMEVDGRSQHWLSKRLYSAAGPLRTEDLTESVDEKYTTTEDESEVETGEEVISV